MRDTRKAKRDYFMLIMEKLRNTIQSEHKALELLPYFRAISERILPIECYVNQLKSLAIIYTSLESELASETNDCVCSVWKDEMRKLPLLENDLKFFNPRFKSQSVSAMEEALIISANIRRRLIETPVTLLGYLYVFEGTTLGNKMHTPDIVEAYKLASPNGCSYYKSYGDEVPIKWRQFTERMNKAVSDRAQHDLVIEAAQEAFLGLKKLFSKLYPIDLTDRAVSVSRINPEAGSHPMPKNESEIRAALSASDMMVRLFPYLELRYGSRGKRFSDSDTLWLVTLTNFDMKSVNDQIEWISRILANRGMPTIIIEELLNILYDKLVEADPEKRSSYDKLLSASKLMNNIRTECVSQSKFNSLSQEFESRIGEQLSKEYKNTGSLLVSAVVDNKLGITRSTSSIRDWLTNSNQFPKQWIDAVNSTIEKAEQAMQS